MIRAFAEVFIRRDSPSLNHKEAGRTSTTATVGGADVVPESFNGPDYGPLMDRKHARVKGRCKSRPGRMGNREY